MSDEDETTAPESGESAASSEAVVIEDPIVEINDVVAGYLPGVNILNGADLAVAEGELVGIIGPNGAGKSTMLKALFGLVKVTSGGVNLRGEDITSLKAHQLVQRGLIGCGGCGRHRRHALCRG